ncbi:MULTISPECIES: protease IV [unclassified Bradyrhizobium]|uniref:protease IV n=1 Tax=unclassified Bradyrhizobium TaxID=2631580 RepID=UPI0029163978|nr:MULTISPECIES: protease IV [unclassified Bradyrhizobium]
MIAVLARLTGLSPIVLEAIALGLLLIAFAGVGIHVYDAGYAAADSQCQAAALRAQLAAAAKDRDDARVAAADASLKLAAIQQQSKVEEERTADYVAELEKRPAPSCALTCDDLRGMRIASKSCPSGARTSTGAGVHGARRRSAGAAR